MSSFTRISTDKANELMQNNVTIVDVRDPQSFQNGHIDGAVLLDNASVESFLNTADKALPVIVYCYHGNSSQQAGQYLAEQGFDQVYSMDGGFESWKIQYPTVS